MTDFVTLWIGERLGPVERACLKSMVRHGRVALYCYSKPIGVPEGVELRDALSIIALEDLRTHCGSRSDLYSDWFRYLLLARGLGTWLDMDVYVVGAIDGERPYLFGRQQDPDSVNGAVLRAPPQSALLAALMGQFERREVPPWQPPRYYWPMRFRQMLSGRVELQRTRWGTTGPFALTALIARLGLESWVEPGERFYPISWKRADWILDSNVRLEDVITPDTAAVHLWNECIRDYKDRPPPAGSFLRRLHEEGR